MTSEKHYPPAYYRYRATHKTISIHLDNELKEQIDKMKGNKPYSEFLRELFKDNQKLYEEWYEKGYNRGYDDAKDEYGISVPCIYCKKPVYARKGGKLYQHVMSLIADEKWYHTECQKKYEK